MNKKITKTIAKGTITFMIGAFVGHNFHLIKNQDIIKTDNIITEKFKEFFSSDEKDKVPSSSKMETFGKSIDDLLGTTKSWDTTSGIDTYGEALAGTLDALVTGEYISQKPTSKEIKEFIDTDKSNLQYKLDLIKDNDNLSYLENLDKIATIFIHNNYEYGKYKECMNIIKENYKFVLEEETYKGRNITFEEMENETKIYFINTLLEMDKMIMTDLPSYKKAFENDLYLNLREVLNDLKDYINENKSEDLLEYKNILIEEYQTKLR
jgi:hypothetical protein